ncbi:MAG TPA: Mur ligase family protein [Oligoflexia bacterium]|nr:Mur ligase family protein [Oligoflexia bacterium]
MRFIESLAEWGGERPVSLEKLHQVSKILSNPQNKIKTIHIGGTNGKGSTSAAFANVLILSGYSVGLNISPHLYKVNERIQINGRQVDDQILGDFAYEIKQVAEKEKIELSHHEALTLIAFLIFAEAKLDYGVIEVGLGGRLDASNIIKRPDLSIITMIDLDHTHILGKTKEAIAYEKAFIIKELSKAIVGPVSESVKNVIVERNKSLTSPSELYFYGDDFYCKDIEYNKNDDQFKFTIKSSKFNDLNLLTGLKGEHQLFNMSLVAYGCLLLGLDQKKIKEGIYSVNWPCRLERFNFAEHNIIFDSAHNLSGIDSLISYLKLKDITDFTLIFGAIKTKNWSEMLLRFKGLVKEVLILEPDSKMKVEGDQIADFLSSNDIKFSNFRGDYHNVIGYISSLPNASKIIATGSIYMIGKLRELIKQRYEMV